METLLYIGLCNAVLATLFALLAAAVSLVVRRPALCHSLWLLVFLKLITPPLYHVALPALAAVKDVAAEETMAELQPVSGGNPLDLPAAKSPVLPQTSSLPLTVRKPRPTSFSWQQVVALAWLTGAVLWWAMALSRTLRFQRLLQHAQPAPEELRTMSRQLAQRMGLTCCPEIWLLPGPVSPLLWALGRAPRLLLPAGLWARLTAEQRASLVVHELAHLRRRDHWIRRLELVVLGLYWWHPVVWWARRRLQDAEEECCDAWVTWTLPEAGPAYASALLETVAFLSEVRATVPLGASGGGQARHLRRRLTMILNGTTSRKLHILAFGSVLALAAVLLPLAPGSAEPPDEVLVKPRQKAEEQNVNPRADTKLPESQAKGLPKEKSPDSGDALPRGTTMRGSVDRVSANLAEQIEQARDEVELMEANLEVKRALIEAAQQAVNQAHLQLQRNEQLRKQGAISEGEYQVAVQKVQDTETQLRIKRAELREPEVRLMQAKRRLARLEQLAKEQRGTDSSTTKSKSSSGDSLRRPNPVPATGEEADRLRRLERQLEAMQKELDALRRELRPKGSPGGGVLWDRNDFDRNKK
jgi:beta-lactamase regulating signal transducer with metallopeptidase domain